MDQFDALQAEQLSNGIIHCAAGADIFRASQLLLDEAVDLRFRFAPGLLMGYGDVLEPSENDDCEDRVDRKCQTCTPIFNEKRHEDSDKQQAVGD